MVRIEVHRPAAWLVPGAIFFVAWGVADHEPDHGAGPFEQPGIDRTHATLRIADECRSAPVPFSSNQRDNRENRQERTFSNWTLWPGYETWSDSGGMRPWYGAMHCARLQDDAGIPQPADPGLDAMKWGYS